MVAFSFDSLVTWWNNLGGNSQAGIVGGFVLLVLLFWLFQKK